MESGKEAQVMAEFRKVVNKLSWFNKIKMEERLQGLKASEVHYIECIGRSQEPNVTQMADALYMTRGAISKMTKKLEQKGLIESFQRPENKKEIYFRLTPEGQKIFRIHEELHDEFQKRDKPVFEQVTEAELDRVLQFLEVYQQHLDREIHKQSEENSALDKGRK